MDNWEVTSISTEDLQKELVIIQEKIINSKKNFDEAALLVFEEREELVMEELASRLGSSWNKLK